MTIGKKYNYKVDRQKNSGLLLIEVDQKELCDRLLKTKKLVDIAVNIEEHNGLNTSKGVVFCDSEALRKMSNEEAKWNLQTDLP